MDSSYILSFIVPLYNVSTFVEQCIRSLYNQDIPREDYEVIVIDDFSPDNSKDIVVEMQKEFRDLKLISLTENVKLGSARNIGLQHATGKYIWFVDSDDYLQSNILRRIVCELNNNDIEILHFDYLELHENDGSIIPYKAHYNLETCTGAEFYFDSNELWWQKGVEAWRKIYRRSFLLDNNLMFADRVMYEDVDYSINMFAIAQKVKHLDFAPYYYRNNSTSITKSAITPVHLKYWILLVLRCNKLQVNYENNKNIDPRFVEIIDVFIKYQVGSVIEHLRKFDIKNRKLYYSLLTDVDIVSLKKYVSLRKYLYLKYPVFNM
jgi:glycosyltransferase involved in cell wall biosynthesis